LWVHLAVVCWGRAGGGGFRLWVYLAMSGDGSGRHMRRALGMGGVAICAGNLSNVLAGLMH